MLELTQVIQQHGVRLEEMRYAHAGLIKNSKVGIATKDSSSIFINKLDIENVDLCLAAYRKKQEFIGALIDINHYRCNNYIDNSYISIDSKLRVKNEL